MRGNKRQLIAEFGERCAFCGRTDTRLVIDHDRNSGLIRGLLCVSCNTREGRLDPAFDEYRKAPPAARLGLFKGHGNVRYGTCGSCGDRFVREAYTPRLALCEWCE